MTAVLPEHTCQHLSYRLTCAQFDALMEQAEGKCQVCRQPHPRLHIDHDHLREWPGVRGLVCPKCNARMRRIDSGEQEPSEEVTRYLAAAWYLTHQPDSEPRYRPVPVRRISPKPGKARIGLASIHIYVEPEVKADFAAAVAYAGESMTTALTRLMRKETKRVETIAAARYEAITARGKQNTDKETPADVA